MGMRQLDIKECGSERFLSRLSEVKRKLVMADPAVKCVDLSGAELSGGTEPGMTERIIVVEWQNCPDFAEDATQCASAEEASDYLGEVAVTLQIANSYASFEEKESKEVLKGKIVDTLQVDTISSQKRNVKGAVYLSPSTVKLKDQPYTIYPDLSKEEYNYMELDKFS